MKIIQVIVLILAFKQAAGQHLLLSSDVNSNSVFIRPINEKLYPLKINSIQSCIAAEVNRKLFAHLFIIHQRTTYSAATTSAAHFLKQQRLIFKQSDINSHFQSGFDIKKNNTINSITEIAGSIIDTFLNQYTIQK